MSYDEQKLKVIMHRIALNLFVQAYLEKHKEWNEIVAPDAERYLHKL